MIIIQLIIITIIIIDNNKGANYVFPKPVPFDQLDKLLKYIEDNGSEFGKDTKISFEGNDIKTYQLGEE